jgi:hypothetical protein
MITYDTLHKETYSGEAVTVSSLVTSSLESSILCKFTLNLIVGAKNTCGAINYIVHYV